MLQKIRQARPESVIRTTFITGLPGEGEAEFAELEEFVKLQKFARLGVFSYSPEPGTPAANRPDRADLATAEARAEKLMQLQQGISLQYNQALLGQTVRVICDQAEGRNAIGRTLGDAPEIDNTVYFSANRRLTPGEIYQVCITEVKTFDLYGKVC